jgi:hypothetical protein
VKNGNNPLTGLLPFLLGLCVSLPFQAQAASPAAQALSSASMTAEQELSAATTRAVSHALAPKEDRASPEATAAALLSGGNTETLQVPAPVQSPAEQLPSPPAKPAHASTRSTLYLEVAQRKLWLEAPLKMCFIDRSSALQQGIYATLASSIERLGDQYLLGIFMQCDNVTGPDGWQEGLPATGFITWLNPFIGATTPLGLPDYLDMREATFMQYAKGRDLGTKSDKKVHRNAYNVSLAFSDEEDNAQLGTEQKSTSVIATTLLRHVPVEITLHLTGDAAGKKAAPDFPEAYATMDMLVAQLIKLNQ